jgi:DNA invertase Pin-like site-specific DNA recombinase
MAKQGCALSEYEIGKIVALLNSTEMTINEIATRMGCSRSTVLNVNREYQVREYAGARNWWRTVQGIVSAG